ncbi:MAG: N-acetylmuramoyl-L-alanine amidase [Rikenellaceae bacterium]
MKNHFFLRATAALILLFATVLTSGSFAQGVDVIIIDPGHGGVFPGAMVGGHSEKAINLAVAQRLGKLLAKGHPDIKIVFTRTNDIELSKVLKTDLGARSQIAAEAGGKLFVSIHANSASNTSAYGVETLIMGESTLEEQRNYDALYTANKGEYIEFANNKDAAIIRAKIQNQQHTYGAYSEALARLIQSSFGEFGRRLREIRRQPIMVLYGTDMPSVLVEVGFMSNPEELALITSSKGQDETAQAIYNGIDKYIAAIAKISGGVKMSDKSNDELKDGYTIQIMSSATILADNDRQFKSYAGQQWMMTGSGRFKYKYCLGKYKTKSEAEADLKMVNRSFSDAFITKFKIK